MKRNKLVTKFPEDIYKLTPWGDGYLIYDKTKPSNRSKWKYLGFIKLSNNNNNYIFNNKKYTDPASLIKDIEEYNSTLPFDPEIYNPSYRENYKIEMAVDDYLKGLGFEVPSTGSGEVYTLKANNNATICEIRVKIDFDSTKGEIMTFPNDNSIVTCKFDGLDSAIGAINSIISPDLLIIQSKIVGSLCKLTTQRSNDAVNKIKFEPNTLSATIVDFKKELIERLKEELKNLESC